MKTFGSLTPQNHFLQVFLIISFFVAATIFFPLFGSIFLLFIPAILFFYSVRTGRIKSAGASLISLLPFLLFSYFFQFYTPYPVIITMGIAGILIATIAFKNVSIEKTIIYISLFISASICSYFLYSGYSQNINPWHLVQKFVTETVKENIKMYSMLPVEKEDINILASNKQNIINFFTNIFPSLVVIASAFIAWINILIGRNMLRKKNTAFPQLEKLSSWKAPEFMIWIFIISGTLLFVPFEQIIILGRNIFIVICFIYLLQGFAIISFVFQNRNAPNFFRYLFYFLIAVQQIFMIPIIVIGLLDIWVDFRRFFQKNKPTT